jgi:hypothetical protein
MVKIKVDMMFNFMYQLGRPWCTDAWSNTNEDAAVKVVF